jgi:hypothetical protein
MGSSLHTCSNTYFCFMGPPLHTCSNKSIFFMRSSVVYQYSWTPISGGGATRSDRVCMCNRKWRKSRDVVTGSMLCAYSNTKCSTVIQVPGLPEVTKGHVTPKGFHLGEMYACATRKWRNIRPSEDFKPLVMSSNVTWLRRDSIGRVGCCTISDQTSPVGLPLENIGARMRYHMCT